MDNENNSLVLKRQFSNFLKSVNKNRAKFVYREIFEYVNRIETPAYLFGGAVREIYFKGKEAKPNDFDIVFVGNGLDHFLESFSNHKTVKNNFGGFKIVYKGVSLDVWEIKNTWAFKNSKVKYMGVSSILETTFLNIESILLELNPKQKKTREVYHREFFNSIESEILDINLRDNPFLELSFSRIIHFSIMNKFSISNDLIQWMEQHLGSVSTANVIKKYKAKYGLVDRDKERIEEFLDELAKGINRNKLTNFFIKKVSSQNHLFPI